MLPSSTKSDKYVYYKSHENSYNSRQSNFVQQAGGSGFRKLNSFSLKFKQQLRNILEDENARNIFGFLLINITFAFVEFAYGFWTNSLSLISDAFHMVFDCSALLTGLIASIISKWPKNPNYSYGYQRAETIGGFLNGILLIFVAFFVMSESIERLMEPPEVKTDRLLLIAVMGLCVNLVGVFVFQHGGHGHSHGGGDHGHSHGLASVEHTNSHSHLHSQDGSSCSGHGHGAGQTGTSAEAGRNAIMHGVFLHILADLMGSVGVIISSILIDQFNYMYADPICSLCISVMIFLSVGPLLKESGTVLMQRTPLTFDSQLPNCFNQIQSIEGVASFRDPHFWTLASNQYIGSIYIAAKHSGVNQMFIINQVASTFKAIGVTEMVVQVEFDDSYNNNINSTRTYQSPATPVSVANINNSYNVGVGGLSSSSLQNTNVDVLQKYISSFSPPPQQQQQLIGNPLAVISNHSLSLCSGHTHSHSHNPTGGSSTSIPVNASPTHLVSSHTSTSNMAIGRNINPNPASTLPNLSSRPGSRSSLASNS